MSKRYCIIGASAAGINAARTLYRSSPEAEITILESQHCIPLNKCFFVDVVSQDKGILEIGILPAQVQRDAIKPLIRTGSTVTSINTQQKSVCINQSLEHVYDKLLLACGTASFVPPLFKPHVGNGLVFLFHSSTDVISLLNQYPSLAQKTVVVVGSGLTGLELADALNRSGAQVTLLERSKELFSSMQNTMASEAIATQATAVGVRIVCNRVATNVIQRNQQMGIILDSDEEIVADLVFVCTGQRPHTALFNQAGLKTSLGGVVLNKYLQTSDPSIYAAGDIAVVEHALSQEPQLSTTWPDAMYQGMIAAYNMLGENRAYAGVVPAIHSSFFGYEYAALDVPLLVSDKLTVQVERLKGGGVTLLGHVHGVLRAYVHYGNHSLHALLRRAVLTGIPLADVYAKLLT